MVPSVLKNALVPGTPAFFLLMATIGTLLLFRKRDHGRTGRTLLVVLMSFYWIASTPVTAEVLVRALTPDYRVHSAVDAANASSCGRVRASTRCVRWKPRACITFSMPPG
jgi:hypothetical protein